MDVRETTITPPEHWNGHQLLEFDIGCNEIRDGLVSFRPDTLAFRFTPRPLTGRLECTVELREYLGGAFGGKVLTTATTTIDPDQTFDTWLSFSGFGWYDAQMTRPIGACHYRVSLDGTDTVRVAIDATERLV
ncbi:hypothetical protein [Streptomyces sp. NPDC086023]|uniref:hypothetical protein n=1 Tax=Streptomyces sp. NPDC086023 TaxID=3365746 RepID=UPI0037D83F3C